MQARPWITPTSRTTSTSMGSSMSAIRSWSALDRATSCRKSLCIKNRVCDRNSNWTMKKRLGIAIAVLGFVFAAVSAANAQTALFIYNDNGAGGGTPSSGTYTPGSSFTFDISLTFAPGGSVANLGGLSYWFQQKTPNSAP